MALITRDAAVNRRYETGTDWGTFYGYDPSTGDYDAPVEWAGLISVTHTPEGGEPTDQYADNIPYITMRSAETIGGTIESYTAPEEFLPYDGFVELKPGLVGSQQPRKPFGFAYRTIEGSASKGNDLGYKYHLYYGMTTSPSEKAYTTINDSPEALTFSRAFKTTTVDVTNASPLSYLEISSTGMNAASWTAITNALFDSATGTLLTPDDIVALIVP